MIRSPFFLAVLSFCLAGLTPAGTEDPGAPRTLSGLIDSAPSVTMAKCPEHPEILAVYAEHDPGWRGRLTVYHRDGQALDGTYAFPPGYEEFRGHYVVRFRWLRLKQTPHPVLELIESTHMGNGSLRLFELSEQGRDMRLLLDVTVRGRFWGPPAVFGLPLNGEARFENPHLSVEYQDPSDKEATSILLSGTVLMESMEGKALPSRPFAQLCLWDAETRTFAAQEPTSTNSPSSEVRK